MSSPWLAKNAVSPEAIEFGCFETEEDIEQLRYGGERHAVVFGANGSGKSMRIVVPNLLNMRGNRSIIAVDLSGELSAISARYRREELKQNVYILNPFGVFADRLGFEDMAGCGYNPLAVLNPAATSFNVDASLLAEAMIPLEQNTSQHWTASARALVAALIMYVVIEAKQRGGVPTMARVRELLCQADGKGRPASAAIPEVKPTGIPALAKEMMESTIAGLKNKAAQFASLTEEIQSIASTARIQTECFDDPEIASVLSRKDFDFAEVKQRPTTVFLVLPPLMMERHGKWIRLMLTSALRACMRECEKGEPSIWMPLDEFAALGHLEIIQNCYAQARKYRIQMMPIFQDLTQLQTLYDKRWQTFLANAGVVASIGAPNDDVTADYLSKRMGQKTVLVTTVNDGDSYNEGDNEGESRTVSPGPNGGSSGTSHGKSRGKAQSGGSSTGPVNVPVMLPQDLYELLTGDIIIITAGMANGARAFAPDYRKLKTRKARARPNPYYDHVPRRGSSPKREIPPDNGWIWEKPPSDDGWGNGPVESSPFGLMPEITAKVQARHPSYAPEPEPDNSGWSDNDSDTSGKPFGVF
jgi:type IV secretory pathway TraG/TraD family ATPase VirD4